MPAKKRVKTVPRKTKSTSKSTTRATSKGMESRRFWLLYPSRKITDPTIWQLGQKFPLIFNIRQASVTDEIGIVCLELKGLREDIKGGIRWLEKCGIKVEPVEINVIES